MTRTEAILHKGQTLFEDKSYILLWTKFLGLSLLALTSYYVYDKQKKLLIKLNGREKAYLMGVSYYLTNQHGLSPRAVIDNTGLFKDVCRAIADRNGGFYKNFFSENSKDQAKNYSAQTYRKNKNGKV